MSLLPLVGSCWCGLSPRALGQCWGTWRVACMHTCVQVSPGFEKGMGLLWRAAVAVELEGRASPLQ